MKIERLRQFHREEAGASKKRKNYRNLSRNKTIAELHPDSCRRRTAFVVTVDELAAGQPLTHHLCLLW